VARRLDAVVDLNPELDLLGVVLFGVIRSAKRVSETAREAIELDLGDGARSSVSPSGTPKRRRRRAANAGCSRSSSRKP